MKIYPVGVLPGTPTQEQIDTFAREVDSGYRAAQSRMESVLVHTGARAEQGLVDAAFDRGIALQTFEEHTGAIDLSRYLARERAELSASRVYPPGLYVHQRARTLSGKVESEVPRVLDEVLSLLRSPEPQFLVVLADFGTGKSFLLRQIAQRLLDTHVIPVRVELRAIDKAQSLDGMLAAHFMQAGERAFDRERFRYMLEEGSVVLLFDGFDELALRVTYDRAGEHLETLMEAAQGRAKVVLTSRSQHFLSDAQAREAIETAKTKLANKVDRVAGARFIKVLPFNEEEIASFLQNKLGDPKEAAERLDLIRNVKDLLGLSHNPRMLSFIAEIDASMLRAAKARRGDVTAATLYELIVQQWIGYEIGRANPRGAPAGLDLKDTWAALLMFAEHLWGTTERSLDLSKLDEGLRKAISSLGPSDMPGDEKVFAVGSGSLLVRDDEGRFSFVHRSVLEFLVAWSAACQLRAGRRAVPLLSARSMSELMADFFIDEAGRARGEEWAQNTLEGDAPEVAKKNAELVLRRMGASARGRATFRGADLRGQDFTGRKLRHADLTGANLAHAKLVGADLAGATLRGALICDADLSGANLQKADLTGTDLSRAKLAGCDARGATWESAVLYRTDRAGALVDEPGPLAAKWATGAALPPIFAPSPQHDTPVVGCSGSALFGELLATAHDDGSVQIWDLQTGERLRTIVAHARRARAVAFGPVGSWLVTGADDGTIRIFSLAAAEPACQLLGEQDAEIVAIAVHPEGRALASAASDGAVRIWDLATRASRTLGHEPEVPLALLWSPDGSTLASVSTGQAIRLRDPWTGEHEQARTLGEGPARSAAFSPDGLVLAAGMDNGSVHLYDLRSFKEKGVFREHTAAVTAIAFRPDGGALATGDEGGGVHLWEAASFTSRAAAQLGSAATSLTFARQLHALVSTAADGAIRLHAASTGALQRALGSTASAVHAMAIHPRGTAIVTGGRALPSRLWDMPTLRQVDAGIGDGATCLEYGPRGERLASGYADGTIDLLDGRGQRVLARLAGHSARVRCIAFDRTARRLVSGSEDGSITVHDVGTGVQSYRLAPQPGAVTCAVWTGEAEIAWGAADGIVRLWFAQFDEDVRELRAHEEAVLALAVSPTDATLVSASRDRTVRVWDRAGGAATVLHGHTQAVTALGFHPSLPIVASGSDDGT
ncbi:MAG: pentapeptide repeat-containing protein, partial [Polyangiaceae bacterium]